MKVIKSSTLLFIEPKNPKSIEPVDDEYTKKVEELLNQCYTKVKEARKKYDYEFVDYCPEVGIVEYNGNFLPHTLAMGVHECVCGERSHGCDYKISENCATNSLAVHYLRWHRDEVPKSELLKIDKLPY